jgi:hypothetical protein
VGIPYLHNIGFIQATKDMDAMVPGVEGYSFSLRWFPRKRAVRWSFLVGCFSIKDRAGYGEGEIQDISVPRF